LLLFSAYRKRSRQDKAKVNFVSVLGLPKTFATRHRQVYLPLFSLLKTLQIRDYRVPDYKSETTGAT